MTNYDWRYALPPEKTLWDTFDKVVGALRNFFASVGVLATIAAICYWSSK